LVQIFNSNEMVYCPVEDKQVTD